MLLQTKPDIFRHLSSALICAAILCGLFLFAGEAFAGANSPVGGNTYIATNPDEAVKYTGDLFCPYNYDGLSGRIVHCIQSIIVEAAKTFLEGFLPYYEAIIISVMVLAVTFYGAMFAMGAVSRPAGETFFFIFKLSAVGFFTLQFGQSVDMIFDIMEGLLALVTTYVTVSDLSACSSEGHLAEFFDLERPTYDVWDMVDCLFITLLGIGVAQTSSIGILMILAPLLFTGGIGVIIVVIAIFFILTLLVAVLRAMKIYLVSVITVAFLICVSPIIIPLLLFSHTKPIFSKWLKYLANYMLVPIFLFAYLSMIVAAYDAILFKGPSSLYYAIANRASQEEGFNFRDWVEAGASGAVERNANGEVIYAGTEPTLSGGGEFVGKDIPGKDALTLYQYKEACADPEKRGIFKDICEQDLDLMIECAINPRIPASGEAISSNREEEAEIDCKEAFGSDYRFYYGFLRNEELFYFSIAPNRVTDKTVREREQEERKKAEEEGCTKKIWESWDDCLRAIGGAAKKYTTKALGFVWDVTKNIVGGIARMTGALMQVVGSGIKGVGMLAEGGCRLTPIPGGICDVTGGVFMVSGSVIHAGGRFVNFAGRVLHNGLLAELGRMFNSWFDVKTLDVQKIASYHCYADSNGRVTKSATTIDPAYIETCPGPEDIILDILYVLITAAIVSYLMLKWLNYIPSLGREMVSAARVEASLPGEWTVQRGVTRLEHGLQRMLAKNKGGKQ